MGLFGSKSRRLGRRSRLYELILHPLSQRERIWLLSGLGLLAFIIILPRVGASDSVVGSFVRTPFTVCSGDGWAYPQQATGQPDADTNPAAVAVWLGGQPIVCRSLDLATDNPKSTQIQLVFSEAPEAEEDTAANLSAGGPNTTVTIPSQPPAANTDTGQLDSAASVEISTDGNNWTQTASLSAQQLKPGSVDLSLPPLSNEELSKLQLRVNLFDVVPQDQPVALDSVSITYQIGEPSTLILAYEDDAAVISTQTPTIASVEVDEPSANLLSGVANRVTRGQAPDSRFVATAENEEGLVFDIPVSSKWTGYKLNGRPSWQLTYEPPREVKPGAYTLTTRLETETGEVIEDAQTMLIGVVAMNFAKSSYLPGEEIAGLFSVLDERGASVCDARLDLNITQNGNIVRSFSTESGAIAVTDTCEQYGEQLDPDYLVSFSLPEAGQFQAELVVTRSQETYYQTSVPLLVAETEDLVVMRSGPTRIFPIRTYPMTITVQFNRDFNGQISDYIPAEFELVDQPDARPFTVEQAGAEKKLTWQVQANAGDSLEFSYRFDAPDISPVFYTLGPLAADAEGFSYSEPRRWQLAGDAVGRMLIFFDGASIPSGWTCVSCTSGDPFFEIFPRGNDTYGGTGGSTTHNHTASVSVAATGTPANTTGNAGTAISGNNHTHSATLSITASSNLPNYRNLKIIRHNTAGEPTTLPAGAIAMFDATVPSGWTQYSAQNGFYARGENTIGTGGSNTHSHPVSGTVQAAGGTTYSTRNPTNTPSAAAGHTHSYSGSSQAVSNEPPYLEVIFGQLGSSAAVPINMIAMWDDEVPGDWAKLSGSAGAFNQVFLKGSSTYGATGGSTSHTHTNTLISSTGPSGTVNTRSGADASSNVHTHQVTISGWSTEDHLPPYRDVVIGKLIPQPELEQSAYRFYRNLDSTDVGTPLAAQDTVITSPPQGTPFRLRALVHVTAADVAQSNLTMKLQYSLRSGSCDTSFSGETYVDVTTNSGPIRYFDNPSPADGVALTTNANDPTHGGDSIRPQTYEEANNFANAQSVIQTSEDGLWDFALVDFSATPSSNYCFRMVRTNDTLLETYSVIPEIITDDGQGHMLLLYDGGTIPAGWSCVSCNPGDPFYQRFPRGNSSYGATGGSATHDHTASATVLATTDLTIESAAGSPVSSGGHTHTFTPTVEPASNLPLYRQLKIIRADTSGVPSSIPSGAIGFFDNTVPAGWTQYSAQNGFYIRGEGTAATTGGSNTHNHAVSGTLSQGVGSDTARTTGGTVSAASDTHTHDVNDSIAAVNHEPPFIEAILGQANANTTVPQNIITMWDGTFPGSWTDVSSSGNPFFERFVKASATYGTTGGAINHSHANETITSLGPSATTTLRSGTVNASGAHTHDINLTNFSTSNNLPPYIDVIYAKFGNLNTTPNDPVNLDQIRTSDNSSISVGGWTSGGQVRFEAEASDPDNPDSLQLCVEVESTATAFDNIDTACGSAVNYSGTAVTVSVTIAGLADATDFHWQVRVKDGGGALSNWVSFGANLETEADFRTDSTEPTGSVFDGTNTGVDVDFNSGSLGTLSANWNITDAASGIAGFDYSIGTTSGGTDIANWTAYGTGTSVTVNSLNLRTSQMYYFNVRATDNAGNEVVISSDGQLVAPTISFSTSPGSVQFNNLSSANNYTDSQSTILTTSTNAYGGYVVRAFIEQLPTDAAFNTVQLFDGGTYAAPDAWQPGDTGYGYTSNDASIQGVNIFSASPCAGGGNPPCYAPFATITPGDIVADNLGPIQGAAINNENYIITHRVTVSPTQPAGTYTTTVIYSVTARY